MNRLRGAKAFVLVTLDHEGNTEAYADTEQIKNEMRDMRHWAVRQIAEAVPVVVRAGNEQMAKQALGVAEEPTSQIITKE